MIDYYVSELEFEHNFYKLLFIARRGRSFYITVKRMSDVDFSVHLDFGDFLSFAMDKEVYGFVRHEQGINDVYLYQFRTYNREYVELESQMSIGFISQNWMEYRDTPSIDSIMDVNNRFWWLPNGFNKFSLPCGLVASSEIPVSAVEYIVKDAEKFEPAVIVTLGLIGARAREVVGYELTDRGRTLLAKLRLLG